MARNFYEFNEELEKTNNPYRNTVQMTHGVYVSPYQQFKQQYPEIDAYGNKVLSGGYLKDNLRRFKQAGRNARLELQGKQPETEDNLMDYFGFGGMTVFHGSPHKFSKFSMDNIGTGEGAQAYGHGLYFAENPKVAGEYANNVPLQAQKKSFLDALPEDAEFDEVMDLVGTGQFTKEQDDIIKALNADDWLGFDYPSQAINSAYRNLDDFDPSAQLVKAMEGNKNLYEVDIPDEHVKNFLDWDAPISEQPKAMAAYKQLPSEVRNRIPLKDQYGNDIKGGEFYNGLSNYMRGGKSDNIFEGGTGQLGQKEAAEELNYLGIKGIKYFDGSSRSAGQGTRNMVVFDDSIINTLKRNNELIK